MRQRIVGSWLVVLSVVAGARAQPPSPEGGEATGSEPEYRPAPSRFAGAAPRDVRIDAPAGAKIVRVPIQGTIDLGLSAYIARALEDHPEAAAIVLDIDTFGGRVDAAVQIRDLLLEIETPAIAYVHPRAISAGALISLACDTIAMAPGGSIGAATPMQGGGGQSSEAVEEKMVSYMRTEMRATAEANGRRGDVAEAMVDRSVAIEGVTQAGKLLTLDTDAALELGIADVEAASLAALYDALGLERPRVVDESENWAEHIARFLTDPVVSGLLMTLGMLGLMVELYSPGWGVPGILGLACLVLFFVGAAVVHLAGIEELLLIALGLGLLAVEAFVIPGFGIVGVLGVACVLGGLSMALVALPIHVSFETGLLLKAATRVLASAIAAIVLLLVAARFLPRTVPGRQLVLREAVTKQQGFVSKSPGSAQLGERGSALTDLHPAGKALLGGRRVDVVSEGEYVEQGTAVKVVSLEGGRVVVRRDA